MAPQSVADLLADVSYAEYMVGNHFKSHQIRGTSGYGCLACQEHDAELERAEAALRAFQARHEAA